MDIHDFNKIEEIKKIGGTLYFLENKKTNLWWHSTIIPIKYDFCTCRRCMRHSSFFPKYKDGWTINPQDARGFLTEESAQQAIWFYYTNESPDNLIITEHIFIY